MTTGIFGYCLKASLPGHNTGGALRARACSDESGEKHWGNQTIELSVVVAAQDFGSSLQKCLTGLTAQIAPARAEILVVSGPGGEVVFQLGKKFPSIQFIQTPVACSIPRLWSAGIAAARGRIVALTIEQCVPAPDWTEQTLRGHAAEWPAIGGAIDINPGLGLVDWAIYFCRYSRYTPPFPPEFLDDLPGDNCSYKRAALESLREVIADGFWETFVHQAMRRKGERLLSDPSILVYYAGSFSWGTFFARRFRQGRYFAARRAREMGTGQRLVRAGMFPFISLVMLYRIAKRVWTKGRYRLKFLAALPLLASFLVAWATGEGWGYFLGPAAGQDEDEAGAGVVLDEIR